MRDFVWGRFFFHERLYEMKQIFLVDTCFLCSKYLNSLLQINIKTFKYSYFKTLKMEINKASQRTTKTPCCKHSHPSDGWKLIGFPDLGNKISYLQK